MQIRRKRTAPAVSADRRIAVLVREAGASTEALVEAMRWMVFDSSEDGCAATEERHNAEPSLVFFAEEEENPLWSFNALPQWYPVPETNAEETFTQPEVDNLAIPAGAP